MFTPEMGNIGPGEFWASSDGRLRIWRVCDAVFHLSCDGVRVIERATTFEALCRYLYAEFDWEGKP